MKDVNMFELRAIALDLEGEDFDRRFEFYAEVGNHLAIGLQVWIDGKRFAEHTAVNFPVLLGSIYRPKRGYYSTMFTCGCGEPACAQITENVSVEHDGRYVIWRYDRQLFGNGFEDDEGSGISQFRFLRAQMLEQAETAIATIRETSGGNFDECRMPAHDEPLGVVMRRIVNNWYSS